MTIPSSDTAADVPTSSPSFLGWDLGGVRVVRIDEAPLPQWLGPKLLPGADSELIAGTEWLHPEFVTAGAPVLECHTFGVVLDGKKILVDTGLGNGKTRRTPDWSDLDTPFLSRLEAAGFGPDEVDVVITTHLHMDHVGWNTRLVDGRWVPTFPRARYVVSRTEWDYWAQAEPDGDRSQIFEDSVTPVWDAGLYDLVADADAEILDGLTLRRTPGHTPGHMAVEIAGGDRSAVITGDSIHHPVQLARPEISSPADTDQDEARRSRKSLLERIAGTETLLLGTHFTHPTAGLVTPDGDGYRLTRFAHGERRNIPSGQ